MLSQHHLSRIIWIAGTSFPAYAQTAIAAHVALCTNNTLPYRLVHHDAQALNRAGTTKAQDSNSNANTACPGHHQRPANLRHRRDDTLRLTEQQQHVLYAARWQTNHRGSNSTVGHMTPQHSNAAQHKSGQQSLHLTHQQQKIWPQQQQLLLQQHRSFCNVLQFHGDKKAQHMKQQLLLPQPCPAVSSSSFSIGQTWRRLQHNRPGPPLGKRPAPAPPKPKPEVKKPQQRRNQHITAARLMVVFPDGRKQELGLAAALVEATALDLDLVEVNARADPPVARIMDWRKYEFEQKQKAEASEKAKRIQQKLATPKEMQFSARIADHDLEVKLRKVHGWLEQGYRVQLVVKYGREEEAAANEAIDYLLARILADYNVEAGVKQMQRRAVSMLVKPLGAPGQAAKQSSS